MNIWKRIPDEKPASIRLSIDQKDDVIYSNQV